MCDDFEKVSKCCRGPRGPTGAPGTSGDITCDPDTLISGEDIRTLQPQTQDMFYVAMELIHKCNNSIG